MTIFCPGYFISKISIKCSEFSPMAHDSLSHPLAPVAFPHAREELNPWAQVGTTHQMPLARREGCAHK